jgi:octopine oxidase subunit B
MATIVIGGGIVGLSLAYGLLEHGRKVIVLDGADDDFRASRGNFGLIWVQGKGVNCPAYANWSRQAASLWPDYAADLQKQTGIDLALSQKGGVSFYTGKAELADQVSRLEGLRGALGGEYPFDVLDHAALKKLVPEIGPKVIGGIYSPMDGHVNPLFLLRALSKAVRQLGGDVRTGSRVVDIRAANRDFSAILADGKRTTGDAVVLAAGLGALELGARLGFNTPIRPQQGQVLITEKLPFFMRYASATLRQVNEGGVQIGASEAEVGFDDAEDIVTIARLARHAVDVFPHLAPVKLVRSWAALRIMSLDGLPIYQQSPSFQGASFVTCHSGITLSSVHARLLPDWLTGENTVFDLTPFSERRFDVSTD